MARYFFRIVGPGIDWAEQIEGNELDEMYSRLGLIIEKFKRHHRRANVVETKVDYDALIRFCVEPAEGPLY